MSLNATEQYIAHCALHPDPRVPGARETADALRIASMVESGQAVRDLEDIKARCGGVWHPAWETRLQSARARHAATQPALAKAA